MCLLDVHVQLNAYLGGEKKPSNLRKKRRSSSRWVPDGKADLDKIHAHCTSGYTLSTDMSQSYAYGLVIIVLVCGDLRTCVYNLGR